MRTSLLIPEEIDDVKPPATVKAQNADTAAMIVGRMRAR
jgi:hypothetical protein